MATNCLGRICLRTSRMQCLRPLIRPSLVHQRFQTNAAAAGESGRARVNQIVEEISRLTLLETADLISQLKAKLKIADIAMPVAATPAGGAAGGGAAAAKDEPAEDAAPAAAEKAVLTVKLESFEASAKAKIIREVKALLGCNLVEAKTMVEKAPTVLKENVVRDDAKKVKEAIEKLGAKVTLI